MVRSDIPNIPTRMVRGKNVELISVSLVILLLLFIDKYVLYADIRESFFSSKLSIVLIIFVSFCFRLLKYIIRRFSPIISRCSINSSITSSCEIKLCFTKILFKSSFINSFTKSRSFFQIFNSIFRSFFADLSRELSVLS
ncbi:MAG: hypothetical protein BWY04_00549 [candidate division CPR1 bacterium ADurb.Bin160]|uniref:Uncharacterized protein n=1 Tax=candidate division CPR1 bacterium ADurb.Bin160 TaxID=1852826 RepID=A0A1V5ZPF1_9BACT|nr:MAG: hypothetical protein BWY04_00549 [candidate division CPR1 bacterium ADurb.Bin160]